MKPLIPPYTHSIASKVFWILLTDTISPLAIQSLENSGGGWSFRPQHAKYLNSAPIPTREAFQSIQGVYPIIYKVVYL